MTPAAAPRVAVVGGGTMGAGIAHSFLDAGAPVVLVEADRAAADRAHARVAESLRRAEARKKLTDTAAAALARLHCSDRIGEAHDADVVIEAVPEDVDLSPYAARQYSWDTRYFKETNGPIVRGRCLCPRLP